MILILMRHGAYEGADATLSAEGKQQISRKLPNINNILESVSDPSKIVGLTSTAPRAKESMDVIAEALNITPITEEKLWSDNRHQHDFPWLKQLIDEHMADGTEVLLCTTHLEYVNDFPGIYFGNIMNIPFYECRYGQGVVLNLKDRTFSML